MTTIMPEGESIRKALKWISCYLEENPDSNIVELVNNAILRFDLSPKEAEFLIHFYSKNRAESSVKC